MNQLTILSGKNDKISFEVEEFHWFNYSSTMPYEMTVTAKGLVCIPHIIREHLDIRPGQTVIVEERRNEVVIRKRGCSGLVGLLRELADPVPFPEDDAL